MRPVGHLLAADPVDHDAHGDRRRAGEAFPLFQIGPAGKFSPLAGLIDLGSRTLGNGNGN